LPSAVHATRRWSTSCARGERVNDGEMRPAKLHRVRRDRRRQPRRSVCWLSESRFAPVLSLAEGRVGVNVSVHSLTDAKKIHGAYPGTRTNSPEQLGN
jgi:hypothetical protein